MPPLAEWIIIALMIVTATAITLWMAGAIYFDACRGCRWGQLVVLGWLVGVGAVFIARQPLWQPFTLLIVLMGLFLIWWLQLKPRLDREWDPTVARLPQITQQGDVVLVENVRNFEYRTLEDYTPRYESRSIRLSNLKGADIILFNWGTPWMSHPVMVFDFGSDGRLCISIEVRYRKGQEYSVIRSLYRQQEIIFLVADERDVILRRTKYGEPQTAHLYHLTVGVDALRLAFLDYMAAVTYLSHTPRWYHGVCANCTTTFYRLPNSHLLRDCRVLANGKFDEALYDDGQFDHSLPFQELKRLSLINEIANAAPEVGFSEYLIRKLDQRLQAARDSSHAGSVQPDGK